MSQDESFNEREKNQELNNHREFLLELSLSFHNIEVETVEDDGRCYSNRSHTTGIPMQIHTNTCMHLDTVTSRSTEGPQEITLPVTQTFRYIPIYHNANFFQRTYVKILQFPVCSVAPDIGCAAVVEGLLRPDVPWGFIFNGERDTTRFANESLRIHYRSGHSAVPF
ncbi:unnamed protein product [Allacma fusca]|uniref:Uncharacterized protein n=1 Tax=Allacma fusca TaxID=39272 RepID=A0A8J2PHT0_9HEXA|nr:unnamed protein product [Allacma fusca]